MSDIQLERPSAAVTTGSDQSSAPVSPRFRRDIEGIRAVAIIVIVAYHAGLPGFSGGFIGVDVFFVVSGYLITGHLINEGSQSGRVLLGAFWARRVRRLVPGLALMVLFTIGASALIFSPFDMLEITKEGGSAALYVSNLLFAQNSQNYFAQNVNKSPFLHTWSLGVEEQFYLVWPFIFLGILAVTRRSRLALRRVAIIFFAVVVVSSFALNLKWTGEGSPWAFFSLPTRAWEFGIGGLLATVAMARPWRSFIPRILGILGAVVLLLALLLFSDSMSYPGAAALVPVAGTVLLIAAGAIADHERPPVVTAALGSPPAQWIGRLSYSWYLWHWPFIVLAVLAFHSSTVGTRTSAAIASLGAAYVAFRFVENPVRFSPRLRQSTARTFAVGGAITVAILAAAVAVHTYADRRTPQSYSRQAQEASFYPFCHPQYLPGQQASYCFGGDLSGSTTVALVGDSHSATWFNATSMAATVRHIRLLLFTEPGCPFIEVNVRTGPTAPVSTQQCIVRRRESYQLLMQNHPHAVILTQHDAYIGSILNGRGDVPSTSSQSQIWGQGLTSFIARMSSRGIKVGVILDNPTLPESPAECVSQTASIAECESSRQVAFATGKVLMAEEQRVLAVHPDIPTLAPDAYLCTQSGCPLEIRGTLIYGDANHLFFGATRIMEPQLSSMLATLTKT